MSSVWEGCQNGLLFKAGTGHVLGTVLFLRSRRALFLKSCLLIQGCFSLRLLDFAVLIRIESGSGAEITREQIRENYTDPEP
jgi:hypothetical protein